MYEKVDAIKIYQSLRQSFVPSICFGLKSADKSFFLPKLNRFINKNLYKLGIGAALNRYSNTFSIYLSKSDRVLYDGYVQNSVFINFGSGAFYHKKWLNYDFGGQSDYYKAIQGEEGRDFIAIDLCAPKLKLPHNDNSVSLIYCSHTLEHLENKSAQVFLSECHRILRNGGLMRIAVPSTDNDHRIAKIINNQKNISLKTKKNVCLQVAEQVLASSTSLGEEKIFKLMIEANFDPKVFFEKVVGLGVNTNFTPDHAEWHISYWDYEAILKLSKKLSFDICVPSYRGTSLARPFSNLNVFEIWLLLFPTL